MTQFDKKLVAVKALVSCDQVKSRLAGHKKIQYDYKTVKAVVELTTISPMTFTALAKCLNVGVQDVHTWRYKHGVTAKKDKKPSVSSSSAIKRLRPEVTQTEHKLQLLRCKLELDIEETERELSMLRHKREVIDLAASYGLKVEFK